MQSSKCKVEDGRPENRPDIVGRTFMFALRVIKLVQTLDGKPGPSRVLGGQLLRSGTSIGANVEEAQGGQSRRDFIAKMSIAQKEARETVYWLKLLIGSGVVAESRMNPLLDEAEQLNRIISRILVTTKHASKRAD